MKTTGKNVKGLRVRTVNILMIVLSFLIYLALLYVTFRAAGDFRRMKDATDLYISCQENAALVSDGSDYLTEQVRLFVVTREREHMDNYFNEIHVTRRREQALEQLSDQASDTAKGYLSEALTCSNELMEQEIYAMRLVAEVEKLQDLPEEVAETSLFPGHKALSTRGKLNLALEKVFGAEYQARKALVTSNVEFFTNDVISATQQSQESTMSDLSGTMNLERVFFSVLFLENVLVFVMISFLIVKPLQVYVNCIKQDKMMEITGAYEFKYLALTYNDIYELNAANAALLHHQGEHDSLTGLLNRSAFDQVRQTLRVKPHPIALLLLDVDRFQQINDHFGHDIGDKVLQKIAKILRKTFRASDYPARIEEDEFAVILDDIRPEHQKLMENKLFDINRRLLNPKDGLPAVSVSIGGAFSPSGFHDELYRQADAALCEVKEQGRCGCRFYQPETPLPGEKDRK